MASELQHYIIITSFITHSFVSLFTTGSAWCLASQSEVPEARPASDHHRPEVSHGFPCEWRTLTFLCSLYSTASQFRGSQMGPPIVMVTGTPATDMRLRRTPTVSAAAVLHDVKVGDIISVT